MAVTHAGGGPAGGFGTARSTLRLGSLTGFASVFAFTARGAASALGMGFESTAALAFGLNTPCTRHGGAGAGISSSESESRGVSTCASAACMSTCASAAFAFAVSTAVLSTWVPPKAALHAATRALTSRSSARMGCCMAAVCDGACTGASITELEPAEQHARTTWNDDMMHMKALGRWGSCGVCAVREWHEACAHAPTYATRDEKHICMQKQTNTLYMYVYIQKYYIGCSCVITRALIEAHFGLRACKAFSHAWAAFFARSSLAYCAACF